MLRRRMSVALAAAIVLSSCSGGSDGAATDTAATSPAVAGAVFTDPQGRYTITLDDDWDELPARQQVEGWAVAQPVDGFTANVNVLHEETPGVDLDGYVDLSVTRIEQLPALELLEERRVVGGSGDALAVLEYRSTASGAEGELHFLAVVAVGDGHAVTATLITRPTDFDTLRAQVEPFMLTLQAT